MLHAQAAGEGYTMAISWHPHQDHHFSLHIPQTTVCVLMLHSIAHCVLLLDQVKPSLWLQSPASTPPVTSPYIPTLFRPT